MGLSKGLLGCALLLYIQAGADAQGYGGYGYGGSSRTSSEEHSYEDEHGHHHGHHGHHGQGPVKFPDSQDQVYHQIYQEAVSGNIPIRQTSSTTSGSGGLQAQFLELFQQNGQAPTPLNNCAREVRFGPTDLRAFGPGPQNQQIFYGINPQHMQAVQAVRQMVQGARTPEDALCMAMALRLRPEVNRHAWLRGVIAASMSRPDLSALARPSIFETLPSLMINNPAIQAARSPAARDQCALVDGSVGAINGDENRLWYFREDVMINSNHLYWHLSNPFSFARLEVPVVAKPDRRGELFYFFHHSILARYHSERLSNGLPPVEPLYLTTGTVLPGQYYAYMSDANSARNWTDRPLNTRLQNLVSNRDFINHPANISISERITQIGRIMNAIQNGALIDRRGNPVQLDSFNGIDLLGEAIEASIYSVNTDLYGEFGIHNDGHFLIGLVSDADDRLQLPPGVMADGATAMRDPIFYMYHGAIEALFEQFKSRLEPYRPEGGEFPLSWPEVKLTSLAVFGDGGRRPNLRSEPNVLKTFWNFAQVSLVRGLDFNRSNTQGPARICLTHLDHQPFTYEISLEFEPRSSPYSNVGLQAASVRLFLAPKFDLRGRRYSMNEQRQLFFPLDYFQVGLKRGRNTISRKSSESTLTVPWPQTQDEMERDTGRRRVYCGCGWPDHLLIPKGTKQGLSFDLFLMITNADEDLATGNRAGGNPNPTCQPAPQYCGIMNQKYPDSKPMNYPFDRVPYSAGGQRSYSGSYGPPRAQFGGGPVQNLDEFTNGIPNMISTPVVIKHVADDSIQF